MMFVIFCYDVKVNRVGKVRKTALKYLHPVQRSVFEGFLSEGRLTQLKEELRPLVNCEEDALRFYRFESLQGATVERLGVGERMGNHVI